MFLRRMIPISVIVLLLLAGCAQDEKSMAPPGPDVVASYQGGVITKDQISAKFDDLMACCKSRYQEEAGRQTLLKEMVLPTVISRAIKEQKIDLRENIRKELGELTDELNISFLHIKFHEQILDQNEKYKALKENYEFRKKRLEGFPLAERHERLTKIHQSIHPEIEKEVEAVAEEYIQKLRREASITKNFDALRIQVTSRELKDFYRKHKDGLHGHEYRIPERIRVREVVLKYEKNDKDCPTCRAEKKDEAREKAESALFELGSGLDFKTLAQKYPADGTETPQSRWIKQDTDLIDSEKTLFSLEESQISAVLEKEGAFYIAKVLEKKPARFKSYEEVRAPLEKEYRWQKGEEYLKQNRDAILFTIDSRPYTVGDFLDEYTRKTPDHECHHMSETEHKMSKSDSPQLCDFAHNEFDEQKMYVDRMIDKELITEDTYSQMIHVEHKKEIEFLAMASLYPIFHREEMQKMIHVTDEMVAEYYQKEKETYMMPAKAKLNMIVVMGGENEEDNEKAFEKIKRAYEELKPSLLSFKKGSDFGEVARKYSEDSATAAAGGRLEVDVYECRNSIEFMLFHGFHKKIFDLEPGEISDVFEFENNYYIMQAREMQDRKQLTFEEVKAQVKEDLMSKEHQKVMVNWEDDLLKSAGFVVYDQALKEVLAEAEKSQELAESQAES